MSNLTRVNELPRPDRLAARTLGTASAAACIAGLAGLCEGALLAWARDPFDAGWFSRAVSLTLFASVYVLAGYIVGAILALPAHLVSRLLTKGTFPAVTALVCAAMGLLYAGSWAQAMRGASSATPSLPWIAPLSCVALFALAGYLAARRIGPIAGPAGLAAPILAAAATALCGTWEAPALAVAPFALREPSRPTVAPIPPVPPPRNVLLIVADTLRADHLSIHGYPRPTSPFLQHLAGTGATFTSAIVQKTKTSPSVASLLTGTYPHTHGIVNCRTSLPEGAVTIAEVLRERGFATHSIVANSNVGAGFNFDQGFESVDEIWSDPALSDARGVTDHALEWLAGRSGADGRPFFLYVHYIDPHTPYAAPAPFADMFVDDDGYGRPPHPRPPIAEDGSIGVIRKSVVLPQRPDDVDFYIARYDGEIAYLDHHLARLFDGLGRADLLQHTLVAFTADHGEALFEHDVYFTHGEFAYEDTARVPLILSLPGAIPAGRQVARVVETTGLAATIFEALDMTPPASVESASFWPLAAGPDRPDSGDDAAEAFTEADTVPSRLRTSIRTGRWKLIENPTGFDRAPGHFDLWTVLSMNRKQKAHELTSTGREFLSRYELYDLADDPVETVNLALRRPEVAARLLARLRAWRARGEGRQRLAPASEQEIPDDILRNLKSLGYVQ